ncbi:MAG TPA: ATP-binding protein [Thermoleophilia bacterium]|nr:ATP-binding protein [Thermoleophilia bacterium]
MNELVTLEIPAKAEYVVLGRLALAGLVRERRFSADAVADLKLALTEACTNSIRHAYDRERGQVHLSFEASADRVVLRVRDEGGGFHDDDVDCPECTAVGVELSEGGMGISIIRAVVDEFRLDHPEAGGTILTLTKLCDA